MFIVDDMVKWPFSGLLWIVKEISNAASEDRLAEADSLRGELRLLYLDLERGAISDEDFDHREGLLLDRLDEIEAAIRSENAAVAEGDEDDEDDEEEDEEDGNDDQDGDDDDDA
jgi:hypothetical protein